MDAARLGLSLPSRAITGSGGPELQNASDQLDFQPAAHDFIHPELGATIAVTHWAQGKAGNVAVIVLEDGVNRFGIATGRCPDGSVGHKAVTGLAAWVTHVQIPP